MTFSGPKKLWHSRVFRKAPWAAPPSNIWPITQYFSDATRKKSSVWMKLLLMLRKEWHHYFLAAPRTNVRVLVELMRTFTGKAATRLRWLNEVAVTFGVVWRIVLNCAFKRILNKSNVLVYLLFQIVNCRLCLEDIYVAWCYINHWIIPEPALLSFRKLLWKKPETIK